MLTHGLIPREVGAGTARPLYGAILDVAAKAVMPSLVGYGREPMQQQRGATGRGGAHEF